MARKRRADHRRLNPDPKYHNVLVTRFVNCLFKKGKKSTSERTLYRALDIINERSGNDGLEVFEKAVENVKPAVHVRSRRVGGQTYQVPVEVRANRRLALAMRWIIGYSRSRGEHTMRERLAAELVDASQNRGTSIKKREDTHKMAEANKAFAHYRW